jgi:acyl-CoA reductase-like NAD-dependent aldehyde dehydrogenase
MMWGSSCATYEYGREGGRAGIEEFLRVKSVAVKF